MKANQVLQVLPHLVKRDSYLKQDISWTAVSKACGNRYTKSINSFPFVGSTKKQTNGIME